MTKEQLLKLPPGTLVDVTTDGVFCGTREWSHLTSEGCAVVNEIYGGSFHDPEEISLHVPKPQVSGTIETKCPPQIRSYVGLSIPTPPKFTSAVDLPTEDTPPKLYTFSMGNATPATEAQIMAQECVLAKRGSDAKDWLNINKKLNETKERLETAHEQERRLGDSNLRMAQRLAELEAPPTDAEIAKAYNTLIVAGYEDEARVLQTLSHVVDRLSEELSEKDGGRN